MQDQCYEIRFLAGVYVHLNPSILHIVRRNTKVVLGWDFSHIDTQLLCAIQGL